MTVASNTPYNQYSATSLQTVFTYNFEIVENTDLLVYQRASTDDPDDATQLLTLTTDYTVTGVGVQTGGTIVLVSGATLGDIISIKQNVPVERDTSFTPGGVLKATDLNNEYDNQCLIDQVSRFNELSRMLSYYNSAVVTALVDTIIPVLPAQSTWWKNAANDAIESYTLPAGGAAPLLGTFVTLTDGTALMPNSFPLSALAGGILINNPGSSNILVRSVAGTTNQINIANPSGVAGSPTFSIADNAILPGIEGIGIPEGTTAERPVAPTGISFRYNTDLAQIEFYDGSWVQLEDSADVTSVQGTASQILANGTSGVPAAGLVILTLPNAIDTPGTFTIQSSTVIDSIINDSSLGTATATNISSSLALKTYIDSVATGLNFQASCVVMAPSALTVTYANGASGVGATLTNAGVQATLSLDGVSPSVGQRVLITQQASTLQNGIYTVTDVGSGATNWVLTRATDFDSPSEIQPGDFVVINTGGTVYGGTSWVQTAIVTVVGTDPITFIQFSASIPVSVVSGGSGRTSAAIYGPILGGTTTTGAHQSMTLGASGTLFQSAGVGALPSFTTTTYPSTNAINTIMYASSANILGVITPVNSAVLISSAGGVPSFSTTLPSGIAATNMSLTTPNLGVATATSIAFNPTTGGIVGTPTNNNAATGYVGEVVTSTSGSTSLAVSDTVYNLTSISLTAGDWDVRAYEVLGTATPSSWYGGISTTSATVQTPFFQVYPTSFPASLSVPYRRISIAATTTVYLVAAATFGGSAPSSTGIITARRAR